MKKRILAALIAAACMLSSISFTAFAAGEAPALFEAELFDESFDGPGTRDALKIENTADGSSQQVAGTDADSWLLYKDMDFGSGAGYDTFYAYYSAKAARCSSKARLELRLDDVNGEALCVLETPATHETDWSVYVKASAKLSQTVKGVHDVYVYMLGEPDDGEHTCIGNFDYFGFEEVKAIEAENVSFDKTSLSLTAGSKASIKAAVTPENAVSKTLSWSSSNTAVATVDQNGTVTAQDIGTAVITAETANGKSAQCTVTVTAAEPSDNGSNSAAVKVTKISVTGKTTVTAGRKITLKAAVSPDNAQNKQVAWTSSNTKIAAVSSNGAVTAKKAGKVTITAAAKDGSSAKATVKLTVKPKKVTKLKAAAKKRKIKVSFKKAAGAKKYQIAITGRKNIKVSVKKASYTSKKLKKGRYTVKVRALVNGVYSDWAKKNVKVK